MCGYLASGPASTSGDPNVYGTNAYTVANCYRQDNGGAACCSCLDGGTCVAYWNCVSPGVYQVECTQTGAGQNCGPTPGPPTSTPTPTPWIRIRVKNNSGVDVPVSEICQVRCNDVDTCNKNAAACSVNSADFTFQKGPAVVLPDRGGRIELLTQSGSPLTVIGITPSVIGRTETTCNQLGGYCYVWSFGSWSTGGRDAIFIVTTPTPTPTPIPPGPWIKLRDTSFQSRNSLINSIPTSIVTYDTDDTIDPYFIIYNAGVVVGDPLIDIDNINSNAKFSDPTSANHSATHLPTYPLSPNSFLSYIKARKQHTTVNSLNQIITDGLYTYQGNLVIDNSNPISDATASKFVLIVEGDVTIDQVKFNIGNDCIDTLTSKSIAILSKTGTIVFSNTSQCAAGVFIASNIDTGSTTNKGLKIVGNLVAQTSLINGREWTNDSMPSLFIKFDPVQYINLLPYLSTVSYQWSQVQ